MRQAANDQERVNSPGSTQIVTIGKTLGNVGQGKTRLRTGPVPEDWLNSPGNRRQVWQIMSTRYGAAGRCSQTSTRVMVPVDDQEREP